MLTNVLLCTQADETILEKPNPYDDGQGWKRTDGGILEPEWSCGPILMISLVDLLATVDPEKEGG